MISNVDDDNNDNEDGNNDDKKYYEVCQGRWWGRWNEDKHGAIDGDNDQNKDFDNDNFYSCNIDDDKYNDGEGQGGNKIDENNNVHKNG